MATDVDFAKDLAQRLNAMDTGRIRGVEFSFDAYSQTEIIDANAWAIISPLTLENERLAHEVWGTRFSLLITMMVKQAVNASSSDTWLSEYLHSFDMMLGYVMQDSKTLTIEREVRYDPDQMQTRGTVVAQSVCTFNLFD